ncbi:protein of unknown function (plasmid) [Paraburkholderia kururiensis]
MVVLVNHAGTASIAEEGMVTPGNARRDRRTARVASAEPVQLSRQAAACALPRRRPVAGCLNDDAALRRTGRVATLTGTSPPDQG